MTSLKVPVSSKDHIKGNQSGAITLVEYADLECPHCRKAQPIVEQLMEHFDHQIKFVLRHFPLSELHPHAEMAAEATEFAGEHNKFWEMENLIFENQENLDEQLLLELAQVLELPTDEMETAISNKEFESKIRTDFMGGIRSGVNGTPTFFINDQRYNGPIQFEPLVSAIQSVSVG